MMLLLYADAAIIIAAIFEITPYAAIEIVARHDADDDAATPE